MPETAHACKYRPCASQTLTVSWTHTYGGNGLPRRQVAYRAVCHAASSVYTMWRQNLLSIHVYVVSYSSNKREEALLIITFSLQWPSIALIMKVLLLLAEEEKEDNNNSCFFVLSLYFRWEGHTEQYTAQPLGWAALPPSSTRWCAQARVQLPRDVTPKTSPDWRGENSSRGISQKSLRFLSWTICPRSATVRQFTALPFRPNCQWWQSYQSVITFYRADSRYRWYVQVGLFQNAAADRCVQWTEWHSLWFGDVRFSRHIGRYVCTAPLVDSREVYVFM